MGLDYLLQCLDDEQTSRQIEFSIVGFYQVKHGCADHATMEQDWVAFLVEHSGHRIRLIDSYGRQSDPKKITGGYVLGLTEELP